MKVSPRGNKVEPPKVNGFSLKSPAKLQNVIKNKKGEMMFSP